MYDGAFCGKFCEGVFCTPAAKHSEPSGDKNPLTKFATEPPSYMCVILLCKSNVYVAIVHYFLHLFCIIKKR